MTGSATTSAALIEVVDVSLTYPGPVDVLRNISLAIEPGESIAIVGPSGCGKSTLLNVIGGLLPPTSGAVVVDGDSLYDRNERELASFRNRRLGFIFQSHHLLPQCSALENVLLPTLANEQGPRGPKAAARARSLLDLVGLASRESHTPGRLSGGERQRVAIARALINEPTLLLADEPTGSLDEDSAAHVGDLLVELNRQQGVTLLTVTHSTDLAARMGRRLALRRGALQPWSE